MCTRVIFCGHGYGPRRRSHYSAMRDGKDSVMDRSGAVAPASIHEPVHTTHFLFIGGQE